MNKFEVGIFALARASKGNPFTSTATVLLFYVMFNLLEGMIERLIFGERFEHWLDPIFISVFISYAAYSVWMCALFQTVNSQPLHTESK